MKETTKKLLDEAAKEHYYSDFDTILWESLNADYIDRHTLGEDFKSIIETAIEHSKPKWISVAERLPGDEEPVLVRFKELLYARIGVYDIDTWKDAEFSNFKYFVTHWQPLPETDKL